MEREETKFEKNIKPIFTYVGSIGAVLMSIAYIITVFVLILGFKAEATLNLTIFAVVNAAVGFLIMQCLKIQGVSFAKEVPENKQIINEYYGTKTKDKKVHSITYFWVTSTIKDVLIKCLTLGASTFGVIYLVLEGNHDYKLILLAVINLIMFICFGLLSLVKSYDFYNQQHIKYMKDKIEEVKIKKDIKEIKADETLQREGSALSTEADRVEEQDQSRTEQI